MINKNNNIKSLPVKICFLRDDMKKNKPEPQEKLSLTFLSSFIQQDREGPKSMERERPYIPQTMKDKKNDSKMSPYEFGLTQPDLITPQNNLKHT